MVLSERKTCILLGLLILTLNTYALDCLNDASESEPWLLKLKLPGTLNNYHLRYDYTDNIARIQRFDLANSQVDDIHSGLYYTLNQLNVVPRNKYHLVAWNDETPNHNGSDNSRLAHSKGVLVLDSLSNTGFYLLHSSPGYPKINATYIDPTLPSRIYGQHYLCINIDSNGFKSILDGLSVSDPNIYYSNLGSKLKKSKVDDRFISEIKIRGTDQSITYLSKSPVYQTYLYSEIISPYYNADLTVESWGRPLDPPKCLGTYKSGNVLKLRYNTQISWNTNQDHSKWAISDEEGRVVCFADVNRMESQKLRGGGALCFADNSSLYNAMKNLIVATESCPTESS